MGMGAIILWFDLFVALLGVAVEADRDMSVHYDMRSLLRMWCFGSGLQE